MQSLGSVFIDSRCHAKCPRSTRAAHSGTARSSVEPMSQLAVHCVSAKPVENDERQGRPFATNKSSWLRKCQSNSALSLASIANGTCKAAERVLHCLRSTAAVPKRSTADERVALRQPHTVNVSDASARKGGPPYCTRPRSGRVGRARVGTWESRLRWTGCEAPSAAERISYDGRGATDD